MSAPRGSARATNGTLLARRGPLIAAGLAVGTAGYLYLANRPPQPEGTQSGVFGTPGMQNIENAYKNAGATGTHTKAYGGTTMGNRDSEHLRDHTPAGTGQPKGFKSESTGDDQRASTNTKVEKKFQESNYGDEKGK